MTPDCVYQLDVCQTRLCLCSLFHSYQTSFANMQNYFIQRVFINSAKNVISFRGTAAALWAEIEQSLKTLSYGTFCKQYEDCLFT